MFVSALASLITIIIDGIYWKYAVIGKALFIFHIIHVTLFNSINVVLWSGVFIHALLKNII